MARINSSVNDFLICTIELPHRIAIAEMIIELRIVSQVGNTGNSIQKRRDISNLINALNNNSDVAIDSEPILLGKTELRILFLKVEIDYSLRIQCFLGELINGLSDGVFHDNHIFLNTANLSSKGLSSISSAISI